MKNKIVIALKVIVSIILLQTLFFKFTGAEESKFIFSKLGAEPIGRIGSGIIELLAVILLFIPKYSRLGAFLVIGVMIGAIASHLTILGIDVQNDGGLLFSLAIITLVSSILILTLDKKLIDKN